MINFVKLSPKLLPSLNLFTPNTPTLLYSYLYIPFPHKVLKATAFVRKDKNRDLLLDFEHSLRRRPNKQRFSSP